MFWDETVKSSLIWHGKHCKVLHSWRLSFCSLAYHLTQKAANLLFICTHYLRYAGSLMIWDGISIPNELSVFYTCALAREEKTCIYKWKPIIFWCTCTIFSLCLNPFGNNNSLFFIAFYMQLKWVKINYDIIQNKLQWEILQNMI